MPLFLIVSEMYGLKSRNGEKFEVFGPPCRNALADVDGSTPECVAVYNRMLRSKTNIDTLLTSLILFRPENISA